MTKGHEAIERLYGELPQLKRVELGELPALATHHQFARLAEALKDRSQSKRTSGVVLLEQFLRSQSPKW